MRPTYPAWRSLVFLVACAVLAALPTVAAGQFGGLGDAARRSADAAKRAAEEAAKKKEPAPAPAPAPPAATPGTNAPAPPAGAAAPQAAGSPAPAGGAASAPNFEAYSKYDFIPGEKIVAFEDFSQDAIGDFPAKWNTNGSGEVVTLAGKPGRWLKVTRGGFYIPEFVTDIPENFTLEFDMTVAPTFDSSFALNVALAQLANPKTPAAWQSSTNLFTLTLNPRGSSGSSGMTTRQDDVAVAGNQLFTTQLSAKSNAVIHVSLWRQRQRVRAYINQEKAWDVPRAVTADAKLNTLIFFLPNVDPTMEYYLSNVRMATGAPDTRNKILTQGKWVTHGILFDVNSDRIKGESYGSLKEIATVLTENADLKVQIVGHTDSDGDEKSNLDLSRRRANAVKTALSTQFAIDAARMDTDGKGESEPVEKNETPAGKASNRRVEFIRKP